MEIRTWKFVPVIFVTHALLQYLLVQWIATHLEGLNNLSIPTNLEDAQKFAHTFTKYTHSHYSLLVLFHVSCFYFLQTWCIPGTFIFNLLGGALFGVKLGFVLCVAANTLGAMTCYFISRIFMGDLVHTKLQDRFEQLAARVEEHKDNLFFYLTFLRIFPGSPNWLMNITFAHIRSIAWYQVLLSVFFGLMPWNYFTCSGGQILSEIKSKSDVIKPETYIQLFCLAMACLLPPLIKKAFFKSEGTAIDTKTAKTSDKQHIKKE